MNVKLLHLINPKNVRLESVAANMTLLSLQQILLIIWIQKLIRQFVMVQVCLKIIMLRLKLHSLSKPVTLKDTTVQLVLINSKSKLNVWMSLFLKKKFWTKNKRKPMMPFLNKRRKQSKIKRLVNLNKSWIKCTLLQR